MGKTKVNGKDKVAEPKGVLDINVEAARMVVASELAKAIAEPLYDGIAENIGVSALNAESNFGTGTLNVLGSAIATKTQSWDNPRLATAGKYIGEAIVRNTQELVLEKYGLGDPALTLMIQGMLERPTVSELIDKLQRQDALEKAIIRASTKRADTVVEKPVAVLTADNESAGGRLFGLHPSVEAANALHRLLLEGAGSAVPKISKTNPVGCQAHDCDVVMVDHSELNVGVDEVLISQGLMGIGIVCKPCFEKLQKNNALFADNSADGASLMGNENTVKLSDEEMAKLKAEYDRIIELEKHAADKLIQASKRSEITAAMADKAADEAAALEEAVEKGVVALKDQADKAKVERDTITKQAIELLDATKEAQKLWTSATKERVAFSTAHSAHLKTFERPGPTPQEIEAAGNTKTTVTLEDLQSGKVMVKDDGPKGDDPFGDLKPTDSCGCGSGKMYKNCHGKKAFVNPKNGKARIAKKGDIRKSEWLAKNKKA